jgi:excisionase family DNA binding protein
VDPMTATHSPSATFPAGHSDVLLTSEAARVLGVSPDTVRLWERIGRLPAVKTDRGVRLFNRADVERVRLARECQQATGGSYRLAAAEGA